MSDPLSDFKSAIVEELLNLDSPQGLELLTPAQRRERVQLQVEASMAKHQQKIQEGYLELQRQEQAAKREGEEPSHFLEPSYLEQHLALLAEHPEEGEGDSMEELLEISPAEIDHLFTLAAALFNQGKYQEASDAFYTLTCFFPGTTDFALSLAHSEYRLGHTKEALELYGSLLLAGEGGEEALHAAAHCLEELGDPQAAQQLLEAVTIIPEESTPQ